MDSEPERFGDLLTRAAKIRTLGPATLGEAADMSYAAFDQRARQFAQGLADIGIRRHDRVAIAALNQPEYAIALFACARLGACLVNLLARSGPDEAAYMLKRTAPRALIYDEAGEAVFKPLAEANAIKLVGLSGTEPAANSFQFSTLATAGALTQDRAEPDDPLAITFTGGTTGRPKGCVVSHRNRLISVKSSVAGHTLQENDRFSVTTPLAHAIALMVWYPSAVWLAAPAQFARRWSVDTFVASVADHGVTAALLVPTQLAHLLKIDQPTLRRLRSLKKIILGGAPAREDLINLGQRLLPWVDFIDDYGQSETGPLSYRHIGKTGDVPASVGLPAKEAMVEIVDRFGVPVATGEIGEVVSRGPHLMQGYLGDTTETNSYFKSDDGRGWTGDLGRIDASGILTLVGRAKEMIVSGGENIYAREVELALNAHPAIADSAVLGLPHPLWGESVAAAIEFNPGQSVEMSELIQFCRNRLADFKCPRLIINVDPLPRTPAGKIKKAELRALFPLQTTETI